MNKNTYDNNTCWQMFLGKKQKKQLASIYSKQKRMNIGLRFLILINDM